jgi:SHS2 domain-containing protein
MRLRARLAGERIDGARHALASDVKAATVHGLRVAQTTEGWIATATLDV